MKDVVLAMRTCLLMTATIVPPQGMPFLTVTNPETRWHQYESSVLYWLRRTPICDIVFCENSSASADFDLLMATAKSLHKNLEILQFEGNSYTCFVQGKGYGDGEIISFALKNSSILANNTSFYKTTGRLIVRNFGAAQYFWNRHDTGFITTGVKSRAIDTRFFKTTKDFYNNTLGHAHLSVNDAEGIYLEHIFYSQIRQTQEATGLFPLPDIVGISGTTGLPYETSLWKKTAKNAIGLLGVYRP